MKWHFPKSDPAGNVNLASYSRTVIEGERTISGLEIFVREVLQNSLDAAIRDGSIACKVTVQFRLRSLPANARRSFLQALNWEALKPHLSAAQTASENRMDRYQFPKPTDLENAQIRVLEITETNTIGLVGPERIQREEDYFTWPGEIPKAYRALCRDDARREKISLGAGGTFGLGKAVLWRASAIQAVLFFSRLSVPFNGTLHRAAAQARLCAHRIAPNEYDGRGFGGKMEDEFCASLRNQDAIGFARDIGIGLRTNAADVGTTIVVAFWDQPTPRRDDEGVGTVALLARYAARYFWPAIIDERLEVVSTDGVTTLNARDHLTQYAPFIELYRRVRAGQRGQKDAPSEDIPVIVPAGPPALKRLQEAHRETQARVRCAMCFINVEIPEERVQEELLHRVAEIRGQGMVIGYQKLTGRTRVKPFIGLALGGQMGDTGNAGVRSDMLLGYSEHVTHTRWDEEAEALDGWPTARTRMRDLLNRVSGYFDRHAGVETPEPTGELSDLQRGLIFPGAGRGPIIEQPTPGGVPLLRKHRFEREANHYAFDLRARIEGGKTPMRLDVWVEAGVETGRGSKEDRLQIDELKTVPRDLRVERFGNGKVRIHIPEFGNNMQVQVLAKTEDLLPELLAITEGELRAKIEKVDEPEEPEQLAAGERQDAEG